MKLKFLFLLFSMIVPYKSMQQFGIVEKYTNDNKTVLLQFETSKSKLELDKPAILKITFKNIDKKNSYIIGRGVKIIGGGDGFTKCEVTAYKEFLVGHNLEISIYEKPIKKRVLFHKFLIPVEF